MTFPNALLVVLVFAVGFVTGGFGGFTYWRWVLDSDASFLSELRMNLWRSLYAKHRHEFIEAMRDVDEGRVCEARHGS